MKVGVRILPREEVLDTQGRAVERMLQQNGQPVTSCRVGKYIELDIDAANQAEAEKKVKEVAEYVLYNPLVESYEVEVRES